MTAHKFIVRSPPETPPFPCILRAGTALATSAVQIRYDHLVM